MVCLILYSEFLFRRYECLCLVNLKIIFSVTIPETGQGTRLYLTWTFLLLCTDYVKGRGNGFQSGGAIEHGKVLSVTMFGRQERFLNSRRSRMAQTVIF